MAISNISDRDLINAYQKGSEKCFEILLHRYKNKIYQTIHIVVQDTYIAEDIFQETFIKIIKTIKSGKYTEEGKFLPWAIRIARNLSIDYFRRQSKMPKITNPNGNDIFENMLIVDTNRQDIIIRNERDHKLHILINQLPDDQKEVLVLRHYADLSFKEISEITGVSINTALGRMRYALTNLRKKLENISIDTI